MTIEDMIEMIAEKERCTCGHLESDHRWGEITEQIHKCCYCFVENCKCIHFTPKWYADEMRSLAAAKVATEAEGHR